MDSEASKTANPEELAKIYEEVFGRSVQFDEELRLNMDLHETDDAEFLKRASEFVCPNYKELEIANVCDDPNSIEITNTFLTSSTPEHIELFSFLRDEYSDLELSTFKDGITQVLPAVTNSVVISKFRLSHVDLVDLIEGSRNTESLSLVDCKIDLDDTFAVNTETQYKLKELVLIGSCEKDNSELLDATKLPILAEALSKTNIKETLEKVCVMNHLYLQDEVKEVFNSRGFNITVEGKR